MHISHVGCGKFSGARHIRLLFSNTIWALERFDGQCEGSAVLLGGDCSVADARQGTTGSPAALSVLGASHSPPINVADRFATLALTVKPL